MVDIREKINKIISLVNSGKYFTINRARQYGKTTTLFLLEKALPSEYICISLSFEGVGETMFQTEALFCQRFLTQISYALRHTDEAYASQWMDESITDFELLGMHVDKLCKGKNIVLMIDEVDRTSNNRVFLHFLAMLRSKYLRRHKGITQTFHSVILAGVYDIKNIKLKMINDGMYTPTTLEGKIYNSPWNIATDFEVNMSFTPSEIATMLSDYESDHQTGMCINAVAEEIFRFTCGYPYLVSKVCKRIDEELPEWTVASVQSAVNSISFERNVLFDDIFKNMENNREVYDFMYSLLILGNKSRVSMFDPIAELCLRYAFIRIEPNRKAAISNKIFEIIMTDYFISKENRAAGVADRVCNGLYKEVTQEGTFNMALCLQKFAEHYRDIFTEEDMPFLERQGRLIFLSFLKPLLNGRGFFHIESQNTDMSRMDIVVDYMYEQFIIELKIWRGEKARANAYEQLLEYMNARHMDEGYLLTFDFRKERNREFKYEWVTVGDKRIFEVIV